MFSSHSTNTSVRTPQNRIFARLRTMDGAEFEGWFFVLGDQRTKDMLNGDSLFVPFETEGGEMHIFNKNVIAHVTPMEHVEKTSAAA